jgi:hypothetical protein
MTAKHVGACLAMFADCSTSSLDAEDQQDEKNCIEEGAEE